MDPLLIIHGSSLLDRASGYVDKSFQKDSAHNRFMKGLQGVPAHCNYRYIALPRRFAGFARSPVCGEHCFFWCLSLQVIFDVICSTSWTYGHIRSTLHMCVSMPGIVYTNYRQSQVITGGRLLRWKNYELIDTMPDNSVSVSDIRRSKIVALTCWHVFTGWHFH